MPSISRRDFLNGAALTIAAGLTPAAQIAAQPVRYPPALTGLRGQHAGAFETAHAQAYDRTRFPLDRAAVEERYDLVVVGAGGEISWPKPTRPGDILQVASEVEEVVPSRSRPDRGMARVRSETRNQRGETVQILVAKLIVPRREATSPQPQGELAGQTNS